MITFGAQGLHDLFSQKVGSGQILSLLSDKL